MRRRGKVRGKAAWHKTGDSALIAVPHASHISLQLALRGKLLADTFTLHSP